MGKSIEVAFNAFGERLATLIFGSIGLYVLTFVTLTFCGIYAPRASALIIPLVVSLFLYSRISEYRKFEEVLPDALDTLKQKRAEMVRPNEYGVVDESAWHAEVARFLQMHGIEPKGAVLRAAEEEIDQRCGA